MPLKLDLSAYFRGLLTMAVVCLFDILADVHWWNQRAYCWSWSQNWNWYGM